MGNTFGTDKETNIYCPIHLTPYDGLCGDKNCLISGFLCLKCNPQPCTLTQGHELLTIDEFYIRFIQKSSGAIDFAKLANISNKAREIEKEKLSLLINKFSQFTVNLIDQKLSVFHKNLGIKLEKFKQNINMRLELLLKEYQEAESRIDFSSFEIPENFTVDETKKFCEKNSKNIKDMENMINLVKKYSDNEKLLMNQRDMETIIYSKNLVDINPRTIVEEKLNLIMRELKSGLNELLKIIVVNKDYSGIIISGSKRFTANPCQLKYKHDISGAAQKSYTIDSVFSAFTTVDGQIYIALANSSFSIEIIDIKTNNIFKTLTGHTMHVYIVRHFLYRKTASDYLISTSYERSCKVWDVKTWSCQLTIPNCHTGNYLYSALLVFDDPSSKSYVLTACPNELIKIWDMNTGTHLRSIGSASDYTYFINNWYDVKNNVYYVINANSADVKIYYFKENGGLYKTYKSDSTTWHMSAFIEEIKDVPYLFESDGNGYLRLWNVHAGTIHKVIQAASCNLRGICLWNEQYVIAASSDKSFKVFDIISNSIAGTISGHENVLCTVHKIAHPLFGESLVTSAIDGKVKLWTYAEK